MNVPSSFVVDVQSARNANELGLLRLFAEEIKEYAWSEEGLRLVADAESAVRSHNETMVPARVLQFTGHMVDSPDRPASKRRFPPTAKAEATARQLIEDAINAELAGETGTVIGIASGANGGDILFHEACNRLGVRTSVHLALPQNMFQAASVEPGGPGWVDRFQALCDRLNPSVLQTEEPLPDWLVDKPGYNVWQRCNCWMLFSALATEARHQTLIALYNPDMESDGAGGTSDFVKMAEAWDVKSVRLDARKLLVE